MRILKGKSRRTLIFSIISVALIIIFLAGNLLFSYFGGLSGAYIDLTERGIYTLTGKMVDECAFLNDLADGEKVKMLTPHVTTPKR